MIQSYSKFALGFAALFSVSTVYAQDWYIGLGAGTSNYELPDVFSDLDALVNELDGTPGINASFDAEDTDTAVKIFGGLQLNQNLGIEFGYVDLGETTSDFFLESDGNFFPAGTAEASSTLDVAGLTVGVVGILPFTDRASIKGKAGVYLWDVEGTFSTQDTTGVFDNSSESVSDDGNDVYYGITFDFGPFGVFYDIFDVDGDNIDFIGISVDWQLNRY